jgi:hypothetical protein
MSSWNNAQVIEHRDNSTYTKTTITATNTTTTSTTIYVPSQQLQGQIQKKHRVDTINYTTEKEKPKDKCHKASFGNSTVEKLFFRN